MMAITLDQLRDAALDLPTDERAELAEMLVSTLDEKEAAAIRAGWLAVAKRRMDEVKAGKVVGIPADQVLDNLLGAEE